MKIKNNRYEVTFCTKGGEIESFTDLETGIQYMWQGHPDYWTGKNPGLFPLVGNTLDGTYEINGKTYSIRKIRRVGTCRPIWGTAGIMEKYIGN